MKARISCSLAVLVLITSARAQPTTFTYQGHLKNGAQPASGPHDLRFRLFDAAAGGAQLGPTLCANNVAVAGGLFSVPLDFGQQFASPGERFLEIYVRADIGQPCTDDFGYVALSPRQPLTAAPQAGHAQSAFSLAASDGSPAPAVSVDSAGNVGIGTTAPAASLQINGASPAIVLQDTSGTQQGYLELVDSAGVAQGYLGFGSSASPHSTIWNRRPGGGIQFGTQDQDRVFISGAGNLGVGTTSPATAMHVNGQSLWLTAGNGGGLPLSAGGGLRLYDDGTRGNIFAFNYANGTPRNLALQEPGGNVGVGTTTPLAKLDVRGDIRLGPTGQLRAAGGEENLRIIRGTINAAGIVTAGSGFTASRVSTGQYQISFTTPFSGPPSITAMTEFENGADTFTYHNLLGSGVAIRVYNETIQDNAFTFIAVGPR